MQIPTEINLTEIVASTDSAADWLSEQTIMFAHDAIGFEIDAVTTRYIEALGCSFTSSVDKYFNRKNNIVDIGNLAGMLIVGSQSLIGMGYMLGYQKAKEEINAS